MSPTNSWKTSAAVPPAARSARRSIITRSWMSPAAALPAGTTVNSGGFELVNGALAVASSTIVNAGGAELVFSAGTASNTVLSGGLEVIEGKATGFTVVGSAIATTIDDGGDQVVFGFQSLRRSTAASRLCGPGAKPGSPRSIRAASISSSAPP